MNRNNHKWQSKEPVSPAKAVAKWNERFPIGTPVRYWTGLREGIGRVSTTRTEASVSSSQTAVVWLDGVSSYIKLSHIEPLPAAEGAKA
jgi:hypothetical protein